MLRKILGGNAPKDNSSDFWMTGMSSFIFHISVYSNILHSTFTVFLKNELKTESHGGL